MTKFLKEQFFMRRQENNFTKNVKTLKFQFNLTRQNSYGHLAAYNRRLDAIRAFE